MSFETYLVPTHMLNALQILSQLCLKTSYQIEPIIQMKKLRLRLIERLI